MPVTLNASTSSGFIASSDTSGDIALQNNGTTAVTVTGGNVGIGTTSPTNKLDVVASTSSADAAIRVRSQFGSGYFGAYANYPAMMYDSSGLKPIVVYDTNNHVNAFYTNNTERMRITSGGELLVGTTSAQALTTIYRTTAGDGCTVENTNNGFHGNFVSRRAGTSGFAIYFACAGNQAGTITHPTTTSTNYGSGSDYRLKDNIQPLDNALNIVGQLKPSKWTWKTDGSEDSGFIAHELQELFPSAVTGKKDDVDENGNPVYQCVDTSFLVATLTAAIQEQQAQIEAIKAELDATKAEVQALKEGK